MARSSSVSLAAPRSSTGLRSKATNRSKRSSSKSRFSRSRIPSKTPDANQHDELAIVVQEHRRLRSRPVSLGRGGDSTLLHEEWLRGFPDYEHRCSLPSQSARLCHHDHRRRGSPISRLVSGGG